MTRAHIAPAVRDKIRAGAQSSADVFANMIVARFHPGHTVDVGCGEGWLPKALRAQGVNAVGVDGDDIGAEFVMELAPPFLDLGRFDVATCFEVAEHVHPALADALVAWLVDLAPVVLFSAAIPGQGGNGHINEQWPSYWADKFAEHGYAGTGALRSEFWDDDRLEPWYRQNLLLFAADVVSDGCPSIVHPEIWSCYR